MENNKIRARLLITIDKSAAVTETTVDFFDETGSYFSGITIRADGKISIHVEGVDKDVDFEDPRQLLQALQIASRSITNYTTTNPAGEI